MKQEARPQWREEPLERACYFFMSLQVDSANDA
jgi:hypothetical protein